MGLPMDLCNGLNADQTEQIAFDEAEISVMEAAIAAVREEFDVPSSSEHDKKIAKIVLKFAAKGVRDVDGLKSLTVSELREQPIGA